MKYVKKIFPKDKKAFINIIIIVSFTLLFSLRIIGLDKDLPNFGIGLYQSKDEGHYSEISLLYNKYGSFNGSSEYPLNINSNYKTNIIGNAIQIITLKLLGNNYYGFRIGYTIISLLTVLLLCSIINNLADYYGISDKFNSRLKILVLIFLLAFFPFLLMGRVVENTCIRMFSTCIFIYLCSKKDMNYKLKYFLITFCSATSWALIYFSNIHLLIVCVVLFLSILFSGWNKENRHKLAYMIGGGLAGFILAELYYIIVWGKGLFYNFFDCINSFSTRIVSNTEESGLIKKIFNGLLSFLGSNMFFYCISLVILSVLSVIFNIYIYKKEKSEVNLCNIAIVFAVFLQSLLVNDWNERKVIVILPSLLISVVISIFWIKKKGFSIKSIPWFCKLILLLLSLGAGGLAYYGGYKHRGALKGLVDFNRIDLQIIKASGMIQFLLAAIVIMAILYNFLKYKIGKKVLILLGVIVICTNLFFDIKYVYLYNHYTEKQVMLDIGKDIGDSYVLGPYAFGYCLYNDIKPLDKRYDYAENDDVNYFLDYKKGPYYLKDAGLDKTFRLDKSYKRGLKALGHYYPIGIFKKKEAK